ncbi:hypothetical protein [Burkholderia diffusa]|uniref:hypothetical protein n=1 Tax=Burkholderia diffusa TaxID=488732 RepID=UPI000755705D|nr:hypothetical protein [Burkholderia diffusa]KVM96718.1 hypothetical protein WJ62_22240 [Burkholderia diffusa]
MVGAISVKDLAVLTASSMLSRFLAFVSGAGYCCDTSTAQTDIDDFIAFALVYERKADDERAVLGRLHPQVL